MMMNPESEAMELAKVLTARSLRVVFAESCTAGMVTAALARVPGVSEHMCGSAVTYRNRTKQDWLGVRPEDIEAHTAVSEVVARQMAEGVLRNTVEADYSAAITGHLGPMAPDGFDGLTFIGVAARKSGEVGPAVVHRVQLTTSARLERQHEAAAMVLKKLREALESEHRV